MDPFGPEVGIVQSAAWNSQWTKDMDEFDTMEAKTVTGVMSIDKFKAYQKSPRDKPEYQQAFKELAQSSVAFFGSK